jgi:hypothetical protein
MPYGASHGHVFKETNSQPGGRSDAKTSIHTGPAVSGNVKVNKEMKSSGLGRAPRGKVAASKSSKQYKS